MVEVVCGVISGESGRILVCRRNLAKHLGGKWEFPGGKVHDGESAEQALARELLEELGVEVAVGKPLRKAVEWRDGDISIRLRGYHCEIERGEPIALEHEEIRWCGRSDLKGLDWAEADIPLVEELLG